jgi:hypothetical protein
MKRLVIAAAGAAAALGLAAQAGATSHPHPVGGGTISRVAVQAAFGWSNRQFAQNKDGVTFYETSGNYQEAFCSSGAEVSEAVWTNSPIVARFQGDWVASIDWDHQTSTGHLSWMGDSCPNGDGSTVTDVKWPGWIPYSLFASSGGQTVYVPGVSV